MLAMDVAAAVARLGTSEEREEAEAQLLEALLLLQQREEARPASEDAMDSDTCFDEEGRDDGDLEAALLDLVDFSPPAAAPPPPPLSPGLAAVKAEPESDMEEDGQDEEEEEEVHVPARVDRYLVADEVEAEEETFSTPLQRPTLLTSRSKAPPPHSGTFKAATSTTTTLRRRSCGLEAALATFRPEEAGEEEETKTTTLRRRSCGIEAALATFRPEEAGEEEEEALATLKPEEAEEEVAAPSSRARSASKRRHSCGYEALDDLAAKKDFTMDSVGWAAFVGGDKGVAHQEEVAISAASGGSGGKRRRASCGLEALTA